MVSKGVTLALRAFEFMCSLIIMALIGNMIATAFAGNPSVVNYSMFVSVFGMASLFYLIPTSFNPDLASLPGVVIILDALNTIFFFCGGAAMAGYLGVHSCSNKSYTLNNSVTNGSHNTEKRCREAQASTAFLFFGFAAFAVSTFLSFLISRGSANMRAPGIRRTGPSMSQV